MAATVDRHHVELEGMREGRLARVHSWELVTAVDGPGTRMTLFLTGCPLRCAYCQNPDTWRMRDGSPSTLDEVLARVERYRRVFDVTGGGLTVSGGEPLMQAPFVEQLFLACRERGIRTALDTSGFLGRRASDALLDATDLVLLDVKSGDPDVYQAVTGRALAPTIAFGDRLATRGVRSWVRFVLVPGLTDGEDNIRRVGRIVAQWPTVERVEILPFHQLGAHKWAERGIAYPLAGARTPTADHVERARAILAGEGVVAVAA